MYRQAVTSSGHEYPGICLSDIRYASFAITIRIQIIYDRSDNDNEDLGIVDDSFDRLFKKSAYKHEFRYEIRIAEQKKLFGLFQSKTISMTNLVIFRMLNCDSLLFLSIQRTIMSIGIMQNLLKH